MAGTLFDAFLVQGVVTGGATTTHTAIRPLEVYDATVFATSSDGGTVKVASSTGDITDTIACGTDNAVDRADTIDVTHKLVGAGTNLSFVGASGADGVATAHCFVTGSGTALA